MFVVWWLAMIQGRKGKKKCRETIVIAATEIYIVVGHGKCFDCQCHFCSMQQNQSPFQASVPQTHVIDSHGKTRRNNL